MVLPLETVLMRHFGFWYCSARELTLEARANMGMKKDELWTPQLLEECRRIFERNKGCYKLSPRALSLMSMASGLTATMQLPTTANTAVNGSVVVGMMDVAYITEEEEAKFVKKEQEEWRKILKPSLGKIKKSKRNKLPPPSSKKTTKTAASKDIKQVNSSRSKNINMTKAVSSSGRVDGKNNQVKGESSTEGESDSNNDINEKEFPITVIQFALAESNASSSDTKKNKSREKSLPLSKTAKSSSSKKKSTMKASTSSKPSKKAASSSTKKDVKKASTAVTSSSTKKEVKKAAAQAVKSTTTTKGLRERSSTSTTKRSQYPVAVRQRTACIKEQGKKIFSHMVSPIPTSHWSSPMYV